jgi:hypothetical protein
VFVSEKAGQRMTLQSGIPKWAPKVSKAKIKRLYTADAEGIINEELIDEVGWGLWSRCDSILTVTAAHYGRVICPACGAVIENLSASTEHPTPWHDEDMIRCGSCGWQLLWAAYHQTYRGKQLFGANAVESFEAYHKAFPRTSAPNAKMLLIDQLIHAFHIGLTELGRPVGANLIEGSLKEVILFLDELTNGPASAAGIGSSRDAWRRNLESAAWARPFLKSGEDREAEPAD